MLGTINHLARQGVEERLEGGMICAYHYPSLFQLLCSMPMHFVTLLLMKDRHHHKYPGLGHLALSVSGVTVALSIVSSVF